MHSLKLIDLEPLKFINMENKSLVGILYNRRM